MFYAGEVKKYVELAEEAMKLRTDNPLRAIDGLARVQELMVEYMRETWEFEMPPDCEEPKEEYIKLREAFHMFSITEAKMQNTWFNPAENYDGRGIKVADIRHYLDDWHVFFMQRTYASLAGKPELNTLDDTLSYEQRFKMVDGEGANEVEIERDFEEISTADLLADFLYIAIGHERDELIEEAYVRGFINKKRKEEMLKSTIPDKEHPKKIGKTIIINNNISMGGLIRYNSDESRDDYSRRINGRLREYNKMAQDILSRNVPEEIESLMEKVEEECALHFNKKYKQTWDYTLCSKNDEGVVSRNYRGPWDYETYQLVYNSPSCRKRLEEILNTEPYKKQDTLFEELEIQSLHTALKTEYERAKELQKCKNQALSRRPHPDEPVHFSKRVSNEELTAIYDGLMDKRMLCGNLSLADFIYWHTGQGVRPAEPLMWKTKNVCHYYVQQYLNSDWLTAEQCFSCKRGSISNLISASNIIKDNREIIDEILKKARQKATKKATKTD